MALTAGSIAWVGFNADGSDGFAFVALDDIPAGTIIHFRDDEWNGSQFADEREGLVSWSNTSGATLAAGTVVELLSTSASPAIANVGEVTVVRSLNLNASDEVLYAYTSTENSTTGTFSFLAALANSGFNDANGSLAQTGLVAGETALDLSVVDAGADVAAYDPAVGGFQFADKASALAAIHHAPHWKTQDAGGNQDNDGIVPDAPFLTSEHSPLQGVNFNIGGDSAAAPALLITEVLSQSAGHCIDFFELYNHGDTAIDLSGWSWTDSNTSANTFFASGTTLAAGQKLVVVIGTEADLARFRTDWDLPEDFPLLALDGPGLGGKDSVRIVDADANLVTAFDWTNTSTNHAGPSVGGAANTSAVWDGQSTTAPEYVGSVAGADGAYTHNAGTGSPGSPFIRYSATTFTENASNDGSSATGLTLALRGDSFTAGENLLDGRATITHLPEGLTAQLTRTGDHTATLTLSGTAAAHANADDIANLGLAFADSAFASGQASKVFNATKTDLSIDFIEPSLHFSTVTLNESRAFDGSVDGTIVITLHGDTFSADLNSHIQLDKVPAGLTAQFTRTSDNTLELRFTGQAETHDSDLNGIGLTFLDGAFSTLPASGIAHSSRSDLGIDFASENAPLQAFQPKDGTAWGSSDTSTAQALDANYMVVGDDEESVLRIYHREGGKALVEWDYSGFLNNGGELDLEGGTLVGDTYYFSGSHSNNKSGNEQDSREYLFAVKIEGTGAATQFHWIGKTEGLEAALVEWDNSQNDGQFGFATGSGAGVAPERVDGFSIEGLSVNLAGDGLLLGFRAPQSDTQTRDKAIIVELALGTASAGDTGIGGIQQVIELNLGGRGIRSIEKAADDSGYLILAGPAGGASDEVTHDFRLFRWDGSSEPVELDVNLDALRDATGGSFETIVDVLSTEQGTWVQLLQDNGDTVWEGKTSVSKDLPAGEQQFVGNWVQLGGVVSDHNGPVLASSSPADDAGNVATQAPLVLRFDKGVKLGTVGSFTLKQADGTVVESIDVAHHGGKLAVAFHTVTLNFASTLAHGSGYYVEASDGAVTDHYGNAWGGISDSDTLNFQTAAPFTPPALLITEVNSNAKPADFFELYNHGDTPIDLSGWQWTDSEGAKVATFGANTTLAAGERLVVINDGSVEAFKTAWGLDASVQVVVAASGESAGLGGNDGVVVLDPNGNVAASINYGTSPFSIHGTTVQPLVQSGDTASAGGHAGEAVGGSKTASLVWDGIDSGNPHYTAAVAGQHGAFAQPGSPDNIGSPGAILAPETSVGDAPSYHQPFDNASGFAEFSVVSVDADAASSWYYGNGVAEVNGYGDAAAANDWLISKAFNLDDTSVEYLSFKTWTRFADNGVDGPAVKLLYSSDYSGSGSPDTATWTELDYTSSPADSQQWTDSGAINLSGLGGSNVYFAFQYQSSGTGGNSSSQWRIDDFKLESYTGSVLSIAATDADKVEGNSGTTDFTFTVTRAGDTTLASSVDWAVTGTGSHPASADDFAGNTWPTGSLLFAVGETSKTITIQVQGDTTAEQDESFTVSLVNPGADTQIAGASAEGVIRNDELSITKIHAVQGSGDTSPLHGNSVTIEGILTHYAPGLSGFYVQEEDHDTDGDASTSEGIFVYFGTSLVIPGLSEASVGDTVRISGTVGDYRGQTQLIVNQAAHYQVVNIGGPDNLPAPVGIQLPVSSLMDWEAVEGMLVEVTSATDGGALVITDNYNLGRYGQVTLTSDEIQYQFTENHAPDKDGFDAYNAEIQKDQIILDDLSSQQNPASHYGRNGEPLSADNTLRAGDSVEKIVGIVDQFIDTDAGVHETSYRIQPTDIVNFTGDDRPTTNDIPDAVANAEIKVGAFNVLNYFTTLGSTSFTTPAGTSHSGRGASNASEFARQEAKIVEGILGLDADVLALNEIQNNGYGADSALQALVNALNAKAGAGTYDFVKGPFQTGNGTAATAGGDAIMVAILYKTDAVELVGQAAVPDTDLYDAFSATYGNRVPVAQTFQSKASGEQFTVVANHFKSKGSATSVQGPDSGDGQGSSVAARLKAAEQLKAWLDGNPTGSDDPDVLLAGDFNSYSQETPLSWLQANGFEKVSQGHSYSFDGLWGSLDHALASSSLVEQITGSWKWAINAEEPGLLDYNQEYKNADQRNDYYQSDAYRSSDHNPLLIGLNLGQNHGDSDAEFLDSLYQNLLQRDPDTEGLAHWSAALEGGQLGRDEVFTQFIHSAEVQQQFKPVVALYLALLGRVPEAGGYQYWSEALRSGLSTGTLAETILASDEFQNQPVTGDVQEAFVHNLYQHLLGRTADSEGLAFWLQQLDNGSSLTDVAKAFVASAEFQTQVPHSTTAVLRFLTEEGRLPSNEELAEALETLEDHAETPSTTADTLDTADAWWLLQNLDTQDALEAWQDSEADLFQPLNPAGTDGAFVQLTGVDALAA